MEEIPDEDNKDNQCVMPEGVPALLMTEEGLKTLQQGEKQALKTKNIQNTQPNAKIWEKPKQKYIEPHMME